LIQRSSRIYLKWLLEKWQKRTFTESHFPEHDGNVSRPIVAVIGLTVLFAAFAPTTGIAEAARDGSHDFDSEFGSWNVSIERLSTSAKGTSVWIRYSGTHVVRPLWGRRANIGELEVSGPNGHVEGMQLRLYDPTARVWRLSFASSANGVLQSPMTGSFHNGVGEFRETSRINGHEVITRALATPLSSGSYKDLISRSTDNGNNWTTIWIATYTKKSPDEARGRDGAHDFDFNFGTWHTRISRFVSGTWVPYDGTVSVSGVWGKAANVEEIEAGGPSHLEILGVRMYNSRTRQWTLTGVNSTDGSLSVPMYGSFANGVGTFYDQEPFGGRTVLMRDRFYDISANAYSFEQAASTDAGRTWSPNFMASLSRTSMTAPSESANDVADRSTSFDFNYGTWSTQITTPSGSYNGTVTVRKIWNGRAWLEEIHASSSLGSFEGMTLYTYDPRAREWHQTFAGRDAAVFDPSMIGTFSNGRGELVSYPVESDGRMELAREVWSDISSDAHHFRIEYSSDGGATWSPAFDAQLHRIGTDP
jgi:hypothetical protein